MSLKGPSVVMTALDGGTGTSAKPTLATNGTPQKGLLESPPVDASDAFNVQLSVELAKTDTPVATSAMPAGSLQLEESNDANAWAVMATPAPIAVSTERTAHLSVANISSRYYKSRYIPTGGVAPNGTIQTMGGTVPAAAVRGIAFTPDGLAVGMTVLTAVNFAVWPFAQTTTSLGTAVTATTSIGATPSIGAIECNPICSNAYYFLVGGQSSPYVSIQPVALSTLAAGTEVLFPTTPAGNIIDVDWHPTGYFAIAGGTTTPFIYCMYFDPTTGKRGNMQTLPVPAVGNVTCVKFSPDGNWLLVAGGTTPFVKIYPVSYDLTEQTLTLGTPLANPTSLPAAAILRGAWHPSGTRFLAVANSTTINEYPFYRRTMQIAGKIITDTNCPAIPAGVNGAIGPKIPNGAVAVAPLNCRYSPDGSHIAVVTATTAFSNLYPIKDQGTAMGTVQTAITAIAGCTSYNDFRWSPNMQYMIMGGAGGAAFQQVAPYILPVQKSVSFTGR